MKYRNLFFSVLCILISAISCSSCHEKESVIPEPEPKPTHTLLIYMMADNSLSTFCRPNISLLKKGLMNATEEMNLVIYKDNRDSGDGLPSLFQLATSIDPATHETKIDTIMIKKWDVELNSCDLDVFAEVVNLTFSTFDTEVKGVDLWSHGLSWTPSNNTKTATRYIGQDDNNFLELWDLRKALENCPHLDYMTFDCCFVGMAEVAMELEGLTDYIFASITEIIGDGLPYSSMLPLLAECKDKNGVEKALKNCVANMAASGAFEDYGFTMTLLETAQFKTLATALADLRKAVPERLDSLRNNSQKIETFMQHYGRSRVATRYSYYDFYDYVDYLAEDGSAEVQKLKDKIYSIPAVKDYDYSLEFNPGDFEGINLTGCRGLGVSIPEFFWLAGNESRLKRVYGYTKWGKELGF